MDQFANVTQAICGTLLMKNALLVLLCAQPVLNTLLLGVQGVRALIIFSLEFVILIALLGIPLQETTVYKTLRFLDSSLHLI